MVVGSQFVETHTQFRGSVVHLKSHSTEQHKFSRELVHTPFPVISLDATPKKSSAAKVYTLVTFKLNGQIISYNKTYNMQILVIVLNDNVICASFHRQL